MGNCVAARDKALLARHDAIRSLIRSGDMDRVELALRDGEGTEWLRFIHGAEGVDRILKFLNSPRRLKP